MENGWFLQKFVPAQENNSRKDIFEKNPGERLSTVHAVKIKC